jgi:hypothetical protein
MFSFEDGWLPGDSIGMGLMTKLDFIGIKAVQLKEHKIVGMEFEGIRGLDRAWSKWGMDEQSRHYKENKRGRLYLDPDSDAAMAAQNRGGIDLTNVKVDSRLPGNDSLGIKFHLDPAMLAQLQGSAGFTPVIINIQPLTDVRAFLTQPAA